MINNILNSKKFGLPLCSHFESVRMNVFEVRFAIEMIYRISYRNTFSHLKYKQKLSD